jgi:hypothetical protein
LWWRDDDAVHPTPALDRLLALAAGVPLALAVIPGRAIAPLAQRLHSCPGLRVLQHGWMHANHATANEKKCELGPQRPLPLIMGELAAGWQRLAGLFDPLAIAVLTPPWNRMSEDLVPLLATAGYLGLSTAGPRRQAEPSPGLRQVNTHADLAAWPSGRFIGSASALGLVVAHLAARRAGRVDAAEPTGLLTHHLVMDSESEIFIARFLALTREHRAARWLGAAEAFAA